MDYSFIFLFLVLVLTIAVVYMTILLLKAWQVVFSPKESVYFGLVMFSIGWVVEAYLQGSGVGVLEGSMVDFLFFGLYVYHWNRRRKNHTAAAGVT